MRMYGLSINSMKPIIGNAMLWKSIFFGLSNGNKIALFAGWMIVMTADPKTICFGSLDLLSPSQLYSSKRNPVELTSSTNYG